MKKLVLIFLLLPFCIQAQKANTPSGTLTLGMRSSVSTFSHDGYNGQGFGGQFRLRVSDKINTEWFADYLTTNIGGLGKRTDGHIGWSVMFYPYKPEDKKIVPYVLAGHCFDYTKVQEIRFSGNSLDRWSSAVNLGLGSHVMLSELFDVSFNGLYMLHVGNDVEAEIVERSGFERLEITKGDLGLEGHLLLTLSVNVKVADLWK